MRVLRSSAVVLTVLAAANVAHAQRRNGGFNQFFGGPNDFYQPPAFPGNPRHHGRVTFARIKYRGYLHFSGREGPGWSHDYPDAEENFVKIVRDITAVRPFIE